MNIALIGFRGTGKTTVCRLLEKRLDKKFVSADEEIEKQINQSSEKFVKKHGRDKFLEIESDVIEKISGFDECVLDIGYNAVIRNENITNLKKNALIILLTSDIKTIINRLKNSKEKASAKYYAIEEIKSILQEREAKYKKAADYIIDTSKLSPDEACDLIMHYLQTEMQ